MKLYRLTESQVVPVSLAEAWNFFSNPHNLAQITPSGLQLVVNADAPTEMYPGMILTYRVSPFPGVRTGWITEITHVVPRRLFVDEQRFGPYRFWHHQHHFREAPGGTELSDIVHYILPYGPVGRLSAPLVQRQLRQIFAFRRQAVERMFR